MNLEPIVIAGPTASGKSDLAVCLAEMIGGEVVSVDSMQVYRGMEHGTAKPTFDMRARVPHHLVDVVALTESFDAACFVAATRGLVPEIQGRGRVPILCGGTGLYFNAWLNGLGDAPAPDPALRSELESLPTPVLLDELARRDWQTFDEIDVNNRRRVVRAVEVIRLTGRPFSLQRAAWPDRAPGVAGRSFGVERNRDELVRRIESRVDQMFAAGLVDETRRLLDEGLDRNRTASQALGYRQVMEHLRGERGFRETVELVKARTRQYAKRQMTWFRQQLDLDWIVVESGHDGRRVAEEVLGRLRS